MNSKAVQNKPKANNGADTAKFVVAGLLLAASVFAYYWFEGQWSTLVRILTVVGGMVVSALVFMTSTKGPKLREFVRESIFELRKVVWPTRQEAMRMTWIVMIVVVIFSLILFGFDAIIAQGIKWLLSR
ncbi:preprotein translocase subunit SecE [Lysobacter sp. HDW10]|uniref:preprotein translocase subunit SecE n=1 Tax=Lysobacter sp. HDW10 TaxID=2714936 RepID=UPI00140805C5|nr:preprotein translocase subunit SecE [Lysobacter sp. HDW10]QIK81235.1 preprotein translocase subunit SecE [Lysobacter sp. HDW10]